MKADKLPWFPLYVRDWLLDEKVLAMNFAQRGIYLHLLCLQWTEGSIPADQARLERCLAVGGADGYTAGKVGLIIEECFEPAKGQPGRLVNRRLAQVAEQQLLSLRSKAEAGRKGGLSSAQARLQHTSTTKNQSQTNTTPLPPKGERKTGESKKRKALPETPDPVWDEAKAAYPHRSGGYAWVKAREAWDVRIAEGEDPQQMLAGTNGYRRDVRSREKEGTDFVLMPPTFYGPQKRYLEFLPPPVRPPSAAKTPEPEPSPDPAAREAAIEAMRKLRPAAPVAAGTRHLVCADHGIVTPAANGRCPVCDRFLERAA